MYLNIYRLDKSIHTVGFEVVVDKFVIGGWSLILTFSSGFRNRYLHFLLAIFFKKYESHHTIDGIKNIIDGNRLMIIGCEVFDGEVILSFMFKVDEPEETIFLI